MSVIDKGKRVTAYVSIDKNIEAINAYCLQLINNRKTALTQGKKDLSSSNKQLLSGLLDELDNAIKKIRKVVKKDHDVAHGRTDWSNIEGLLKVMNLFLGQYHDSDNLSEDLNTLEGILDVLKRLKNFFLSLRSW